VDYDPNWLGDIQGCDGFAPEIHQDAAASQVRAPGEWFTSEDQLNAYLAQSITCQDDCWEMTAPQFDATPTGWGCYFSWDADCANTLVTTTAIDRCGNTATSSFNVRYDDTAPVVGVTLGEFTQSTYALSSKPPSFPPRRCLYECARASKYACTALGFTHGARSSIHSSLPPPCTPRHTHIQSSRWATRRCP